MGKEIERKFTVHLQEWKALKKPKPIYIEQNYLFYEKPFVSRVRIKNNIGFITIKHGEGISRLEYEYEIPLKDAKELMQLHGQFLPIVKNRYEVLFGGMLWEVDVFLGDNKGLVIAEIELESETQEFETPPWVDREVSKISKYLNFNLQQQPYTKW